VREMDRQTDGAEDLEMFDGGNCNRTERKENTVESIMIIIVANKLEGEAQGREGAITVRDASRKLT
jgi:hypothetical protein